MDSDLWIQILELVILLALSGFFSSAETAMVSGFFALFGTEM